LSFIVIGCRFFCHPCSQSPRQSGHWGRCPVRSDFRCDPEQPNSRTRSRLLEEKDRRPVRALAASSLERRRDPGAGFSVVALEALLDPPPTQGCANGVTQGPGGCPAGKAVWPRLIITPGKLRGAM